MIDFTEKERSRYQRQMLIPGWGEAAQEKLKSAAVFVAGAGGLGCPALMYLALAGVGTVRLCDSGTVYPTNLNRQLLYRGKDAGERKAAAAKRALCDINPHVQVEAYDAELTEDSIADIAGDSDIILDCLDSFPVRHLLNRHAVRTGIPFVHAGVEGLVGQLTFISPRETPCLYCLFPGSPRAKELFPIAGFASGIIGTLQAGEAVKWLAGVGETLSGRLLFVDTSAMEFETVSVRRNAACPVCGRQ